MIGKSRIQRSTAEKVVDLLFFPKAIPPLLIENLLWSGLKIQVFANLQTYYYFTIDNGIFQLVKVSENEIFGGSVLNEIFGGPVLVADKSPTLRKFSIIAGPITFEVHVEEVSTQLFNVVLIQIIFDRKVVYISADELNATIQHVTKFTEKELRLH